MFLGLLGEDKASRRNEELDISADDETWKSNLLCGICLHKALPGQPVRWSSTATAKKSQHLSPKRMHSAVGQQPKLVLVNGVRLPVHPCVFLVFLFLVLVLLWYCGWLNDIVYCWFYNGVRLPVHPLVIVRYHSSLHASKCASNFLHANDVLHISCTRMIGCLACKWWGLY